ncbi:MAG TPA: response regulator [Burkholderiaceae bacterium]|nr:response regulator [Burkholderiaceae bacterium]
MAAPIVYVVDDEPAVRDSIAMLLRSVDLKSRTFSNARDFLAQYDRGVPACLITDVRMPGMSGLELQETLTSAGAALPVIIVTGHGDIAMAVRAMKAGAADFLEKPFKEQQLLDAVHRALAQQQTKTAPSATRAEYEARIEALTPREREVMLLVAEGHPNKVVASRLNLSTRTVEVHRANAMDKLQAKSLAEVVRIAIACGLLQT